MPILGCMTWDEAYVKGIIVGQLNGDPTEGYVVRVTDSFHYDDFGVSVAKWVRRNHVQTDEHWRRKEVVPNGVKIP